MRIHDVVFTFFTIQVGIALGICLVMHGTILEHREEIEKYLNVQSLKPHLIKHRLIDLSSEVIDEKATRRESSNRLVKVLVDGGDETYSRFIQALRDENEHLGHRYLAQRLEGLPDDPGHEADVGVSENIEQRVRDNMPEVVKNLNGRELLQYLFQNHLLTPDEFEDLNCAKYIRSDENYRILRIIATKGPTAYSLFASCIELSFSKVPEHIALHKLLSSHLAVNEFRKRSEPFCSVQRKPYRIEAEGMLVSKKYFEIIKQLRRLYLENRVEEAEQIVNGTKINNSIELDVALLLESCTAFITKKKVKEVKARVAKAEEMCHHITSTNNKTILEARCLWTLGKMHRYLNDNTTASDYITKARSTLFNFAPGEDTALVNYCHAVIQLDKVGPDGNCAMNTFDEAMRSLQIAIHDAELDDYGLDLCHPKIRLAQLYLGSSPHKVGKPRNSDSINNAWALLSGLKDASMASRTRCIYYYTMADFYWNKSNSVEARHFAQLALDIATKNSFETEISSVQSRLACIQTEKEEHQCLRLISDTPPLSYLRTADEHIAECGHSEGTPPKKRKILT